MAQSRVRPEEGIRLIQPADRRRARARRTTTSLKACGFPIGSAAYVTADTRGELALNRLGLGIGRRIKIVAADD